MKMRITLIVVAVFGVASCQKGDRCSEVLDKVVDQAYPKDKVDVAKAIVIRRCTEDKWSSDALDCYAKATSKTELRACRGKLLVEQAQKLQAEEVQVKIRGGDAMMAKMSELKDRMCACQEGDRDCASKIQKEMTEYGDANKDVWKNERMTDEDMKAATEIGTAMAKCTTKAMGNSASDVMARMVGFKDSMCACKEGDKDCALKVQKDMADYAEAHKEMKDQRMSDDDMKKATALGMEMAKCSAKAMGGKGL